MAEAPAVQPTYVSYCIQRIDRPDAGYTLFWVQDSNGAHTLAMVVRPTSASHCSMCLSAWGTAMQLTVCIVFVSGKRRQAQQKVEVQDAP